MGYAQAESSGRDRRDSPLRHPHGRWKPITADGIALFNPASVPVTRYRYRGNTIPNPWTGAITA